MIISNDCNLVLENLYYYDFRSCYYTILKSIGWDLSDIDFEIKRERNKQLGLLQKGNPQLAHFLIRSTTDLINLYISINKLKNNNIIIRQRDGFILNRKLNNMDTTMPIELRGIVSKLIISMDRKKFLSITYDGVIEIKGIRGKTSNVSFFELFKNLEFSNKKNLLNGLENIRKKILSSKNILWFSKEIDNDLYELPLVGGENIKINKSGLFLVDHTEIDKHLIWNNLIWPFVQSLILHCHSK